MVRLGEFTSESLVGSGAAAQVLVEVQHYVPSSVLGAWWPASAIFPLGI